MTSTQRRELTTLRRDISKAGSLIRRKEGEEAKKLLDGAESQLKEIASAAGLDANDRAIGSIQKAIDQLPVKYRTVIVLRDIEELSYEQISDILGCPTGTIKSRVNRARLRLQEMLRHWEIAQ